MRLDLKDEGFCVWWQCMWPTSCLLKISSHFDWCLWLSSSYPALLHPETRRNLKVVALNELSHASLQMAHLNEGSKMLSILASQCSDFQNLGSLWYMCWQAADDSLRLLLRRLCFAARKCDRASAGGCFACMLLLKPEGCSIWGSFTCAIRRPPFQTPTHQFRGLQPASSSCGPGLYQYLLHHLCVNKHRSNQYIYCILTVCWQSLHNFYLLRRLIFVQEFFENRKTS